MNTAKSKKVIFFLGELKLPVVKCKRPSFKCHRGRTWDAMTIYLDDEPLKVHLDTSWGDFLYFQHGETNQWYKVRMLSTLEDDFKGMRYDLDPFSNPKPRLTTK